MAAGVAAARRSVPSPRLIIAAVILVFAAVLVAAQNSTVLFPQLWSYRLVDQRTAEVTVYVAPCSWTRVTGVAETADTLVVTVETLPCPLPLPGTADLVRRELSVPLPDEIGQRALTDAQGHQIPVREAGS